jgi:microcystin-dependent protein
VQEEQTLSGAQTVVNLATATTSGLAVYIEGIRLHPGDYTINSSTQITLGTTYPAGSKILLIQNEPAGETQFLKSLSNLSDVSSKQAARANLGFPSATDPNFMGELWKSLMAFQYPVGELLMTRRVGNPSSWLGFGTWERYGAGRTIVSLDPLDASFQTLDQTGGSKTHVLTVGELPSHTHSVDPPQTATSAGGAHAHGLLSDTGVVNSGEGTGPNISSKGIGYTSTGNRPQVLTDTTGTHTHVIDIAPFDSAATGSGQGHNNLQPYIVINIWKRTA